MDSPHPIAFTMLFSTPPDLRHEHPKRDPDANDQEHKGNDEGPDGEGRQLAVSLSPAPSEEPVGIGGKFKAVVVETQGQAGLVDGHGGEVELGLPRLEACQHPGGVPGKLK